METAPWDFPACFPPYQLLSSVPGQPDQRSDLDRRTFFIGYFAPNGVKVVDVELTLAWNYVCFLICLFVSPVHVQALLSIVSIALSRPFSCGRAVVVCPKGSSHYSHPLCRITKVRMVCAVSTNSPCRAHRQQRSLRCSFGFIQDVTKHRTDERACLNCVPRRTTITQHIPFSRRVFNLSGRNSETAPQTRGIESRRLSAELELNNTGADVKTAPYN